MATQNAPQKNFDTFYNGDNSFILGGATWHWRPLHWREWGETIDARVAEEEVLAERRRARIDELIAEGKTRDEAELEVSDDETLVESFEDVIDRIAVYLEPSEVDSFKSVLNDREKRITIAQLQALMVWLQEVQTPDRPTNTPAPSSPGPGTPGAISPAA